MRVKQKSLALLCAFPLIGASPPGFAVWTPAELKETASNISAKGAKFGSHQFEKFGDHYAMLAHRTADGSAELHETEADLFVVESGSATLVVGGKMVDARKTAANEMRGASIQGGVKRRLATGDIVHIPAKTPHQLLLEGSSEFTYFVLKIGRQ